MNNVIAKSIIFETLIGPALDGSGEVPEPWEDWRQDFTDMANEAKTAAAQADVASTQAGTAATSASQSANDAANSATAAQTAQVNAEDAADRAEEAAGSIGDLAEDAEAWAVGQRGGADVPDTDPAYENNAKYYAEQAGLSESNASASANIASTQAGNATTAASDAADSARVASEAADEIKELTAEAVTLPPGSDATANYDPITGVLALGIPEGEPGSGVSVHICSAAEYDAVTRIPTISNPDANTFYLVPTDNGDTGNMFAEWIYTNGAWERFGFAGADLDGVVKTTDYAEDHGSAGIVRINDAYGIYLPYGKTMPIAVRAADANAIKAGTEIYRPIVPNFQHVAAFYGLAKAAGDTTQVTSNRAVGQYTDAAKAAINQMLEQVVSVPGVVPVITGVAGTRYICGQVTTIDILSPSNGIIDVIFESGSTPTVLTVTPPSGITDIAWVDGFDPSNLSSNATYWLKFINGQYGVATAWGLQFSPNIPTGGTTGQVLSKASGTDYDTTWTTPSGGDVTDVQVNGVSVVSSGVANVPIGTGNRVGVVRGNPIGGTQILSDGKINTAPASESDIKAGIATYKPVAPNRQHESTFYGLAKAAGDSTQAASANAVGTYTDEAKSAIRTMLGAVGDVQIDGTSVVTDGVAEIPIADTNNLGAVKAAGPTFGININNLGQLSCSCIGLSEIKQGSGNAYKPLPSGYAKEIIFYGLAKAAGDSTQSASSNAVGTYTDSAKSAISQMLNGPVSVSGTTPSITALPGVRYVCGECATLDITLPASGCVDVTFTSGSTPTVLTITPPTGVTLKWANGFDPTALEANTTYEINIADGLGVAGSWT